MESAKNRYIWIFGIPKLIEMAASNDKFNGYDIWIFLFNYALATFDNDYENQIFLINETFRGCESTY